jgi:hypothetical protein
VRGGGVPQDYTQARQWLEKAAAAGTAGATVNLGFLYEKSHRVPQGLTRDQQWVRKNSHIWEWRSSSVSNLCFHLNPLFCPKKTIP